MTYYFCQNLLNITQVHWNQYRSCVRNGILSDNSYYTAVCCVNTVNSMWIFCMHGMHGLPATFAEIWCMHLKTLHGILFPRTQRAPCDVSSSNAWVNWRQGIVIINVTLVYVRIHIHGNYKLAVHLKTISFLGHKLYFNLYGTFPIKSNDVTFISIALLKWIKKGEGVKSLRGRGSCHLTCHRYVRLPVAAATRPATSKCACHRTCHRYVRLPCYPSLLNALASRPS